MSKKRFLLLAVVLILTLFGFVLGQAVNAAIGSPGTQSDPLVTKSYIDTEIAKLQTKIDSLKADIDEFKKK